MTNTCNNFSVEGRPRCLEHMRALLAAYPNAHSKIACDALIPIGFYFLSWWIDCKCIHKTTYSCIPVVIDEETSYCTCEPTEDTYVKCGECINSGEDSCGTYVTCRESCAPVDPGDECPGDCMAQ